jgi:gas vesicle protein
VFILHNVHESAPLVFTTRWAMSFLRGPLTRNQVKELVGEQPPVPTVAAPAPAPAAAPAARPPEPQPQPQLPYSTVPPQLPSTVKQVFLPVELALEAALAEMSRDRGWSVRTSEKQQSYLVYEPALVGLATVRFPHAKSRQTHTEEIAHLWPLEGKSNVVDWGESRVKLEARELDNKPQRDAYFAELPPDMGEAKRYTALEGEFNDYLYYNSVQTLRYNPHIKLYSEFGETDKAFQRRCRDAAEDAHKEEADKLKAKFERDLDRFNTSLQREERELEEDKIEHDARKQEELLSGVESVFGMLSGRRSSSRLSKASTKRRLTRQAKAEIEESEETIEQLEDQIEKTKKEMKQALDDLAGQWAERIDDWEEEEVHPRRADVRIEVFALAWLPRWDLQVGDQTLSIPAYQETPA